MEYQLVNGVSDYFGYSCGSIGKAAPEHGNEYEYDDDDDDDDDDERYDIHILYGKYLKEFEMDNDNNCLFHKTGDIIDIYLDLNSKHDDDKTVTFKLNNDDNLIISYKLDGDTDYGDQEPYRYMKDPKIMIMVYKLKLEFVYDDIKVQLLSFKEYM